MRACGERARVSDGLSRQPSICVVSFFFLMHVFKTKNPLLEHERERWRGHYATLSAGCFCFLFWCRFTIAVLTAGCAVVSVEATGKKIYCMACLRCRSCIRLCGAPFSHAESRFVKSDRG